MSSHIRSKLRIPDISNLRFWISWILMCLVLTNLSGQPQFTVERLQFNTSQFDEFSPFFYNGGLVFCSNSKSEVVITYTDTSDEAQNMVHLYYVKQKDNKKWEKPGLFSSELTSHFNQGQVCLFNDNKSLAFTQNIYSTKKFGNYLKENNRLGIFFADSSNGRWINIKAFNYNSPDYNIQHPAITNDGKTMYFASDMPGGFGGFDIYVTYFNNGTWSKPENLGPNVNTDRNEAFPFIHQSGRLFFSSQGWSSKGGYDIFFTLKSGGEWIHPQSMKEPFNTSYDDFGFIADPSLETGYFTSNRSKSDDIYSFKSTISELENCKPFQKNNFCYVFFENGTSEGDVNGTMKYEWDLGDGTKIRAIQAEHCFAKPGTYQVKLNVIDSLTNEVYFKQAEYNFKVEEIEQPVISGPEYAVEGQPITLDAKKSNLKFKVAKYYWDFGDESKGMGDQVNHTFYQQGVYDVKLAVESIAGRNGVKKACVYIPIVVKPANK